MALEWSGGSDTGHDYRIGSLLLAALEALERQGWPRSAAHRGKCAIVGAMSLQGRAQGGLVSHSGART